MIIDSRTEFCDATQLNTGAAGTYLIGNVVDLVKSGLDLGQGEPLYLVIAVEGTASSGGGATATFKLASDAQAAIATDGSATEHVVTPAIPLAGLVAGRKLAVIPLPSGSYERYLGILQVTGTAAFTAGKVNVWLGADGHGWKAYPNAS